MSPDTIAALLGWVSMLSGLPAPDVRVEYVPHQFFETVVCGGKPCTKVQGAYLDHLAPELIFVDERYRDDDSLLTRGLILHEMVHAAQYASDQYDPNDCDDSLRRERQAYHVQDQFLIAHGHRPPLRFVQAVCAKEGEGS